MKLATCLMIAVVLELLSVASSIKGEEEQTHTQTQINADGSIESQGSEEKQTRTQTQINADGSIESQGGRSESTADVNEYTEKGDTEQKEEIGLDRNVTLATAEVPCACHQGTGTLRPAVYEVLDLPPDFMCTGEGVHLPFANKDNKNQGKCKCDREGPGYLTSINFQNVEYNDFWNKYATGIAEEANEQLQQDYATYKADMDSQRSQKKINVSDWHIISWSLDRFPNMDEKKKAEYEEWWKKEEVLFKLGRWKREEEKNLIDKFELLYGVTMSWNPSFPGLFQMFPSTCAKMSVRTFEETNGFPSMKDGAAKKGQKNGWQCCCLSGTPGQCYNADKLGTEHKPTVGSYSLNNYHHQSPERACGLKCKHGVKDDGYCVEKR